MRNKTKKKGKASTRKETVIVFSAHSDDFVIGAGGTIRNYVQEKKNVVAIVLSYGEKSHPWLKESVIQKMRAQETLEASRILGCRTYIYNLRELHFQEDYEKKALEKEIMRHFRKGNITKVFTHSNEDPHPDHKATNRITHEIIEKIEPKPELYVYSVWNPISFKTQYPSLYSDISKTFFTKLKALRTFRSQKIHVAYPFFLLLFRAIKDGLKIRRKFGEQFFRIR